MPTAEVVSLAVAKKGTKMIIPISNRRARGNLERIDVCGVSEHENPRANFKFFSNALTAQRGTLVSGLVSMRISINWASFNCKPDRLARTLAMKRRQESRTVEISLYGLMRGVGQPPTPTLLEINCSFQ